MQETLSEDHVYSVVTADVRAKDQNFLSVREPAIMNPSRAFIKLRAAMQLTHESANLGCLDDKFILERLALQRVEHVVEDRTLTAA